MVTLSPGVSGVIVRALVVGSTLALTPAPAALMAAAMPLTELSTPAAMETGVKVPLTLSSMPPLPKLKAVALA